MATAGGSTPRRREELKLAWEEAHERGPKWRKLLLAGMSRLDAGARDLTLKVLGRAREMITGLGITLNNLPARYDSSWDIVAFTGAAFGSPVECAVSRETLEDYFAADNPDKAGRVEAFLKSRSKIEQLIRRKYLSWPVEDPETVLLKTMDVEKLIQATSTDPFTPTRLFPRPGNPREA